MMFPSLPDLLQNINLLCCYLHLDLGLLLWRLLLLDLPIPIRPRKHQFHRNWFLYYIGIDTLHLPKVPLVVAGAPMPELLLGS